MTVRGLCTFVCAEQYDNLRAHTRQRTQHYTKPVVELRRGRATERRRRWRRWRPRGSRRTDPVTYRTAAAADVVGPGRDSSSDRRRCRRHPPAVPAPPSSSSSPRQTLQTASSAAATAVAAASLRLHRRRIPSPGQGNHF